ncbi:MAG: 4-hydroxy-tetrahydrodipicolinate reductase [Acidobacteriota bacterium]|nr:4-hydroxy-tetrahydrodipicolinate reductase [Acidobacteriota bacterium]
MNLALVGYGKMGRLIDQLAPEYGFTVTARVENSDAIGSIRDASVAIDFSVAGAVVGNAERLAEAGVNIVEGTTGWLEHLPEVKASLEKHGTAMVWSPNYSVGVNVFFRLAAQAAALLRDAPEYEAWVWEIHHSAKKDAPSGTLLKLVAEMKGAGITRVNVASNRAGAIPGTHEIGFDSAADTITLRHAARNREGFARGALKAAQWVVGKTGFHEFDEVLFS